MTKPKPGSGKGRRRPTERVASATAPGRSRVAAPAPGRADRLREARLNKGLGRKDAAERLGWSESRLISYEAGGTQPNASELERMATVYGVDVVKLAFGDASRDGSTAVLWIPGLDGRNVPVPLGLIAGVPGPFLCVELLMSPGLGLSAGDVLVLEVEAPRQHGALWAARSGHGDVSLGWLEGAGGRKTQLRIDAAGTALGVTGDDLLGRVVATMQRVRG